MKNEEQQVLALAATIQALSTVQDVAVKGQFDEYRALPVFHALTHYSPDDTLSAYNNDFTALYNGMSQLKHLLSDKLDRDLAQYLLAVLSLELKLVKNLRMRHTLQRELQDFINESQAAALRNDAESVRFSMDEDNFDDDEQEDDQTQKLNDYLVSDDAIARFAEIYKQTASNTEPRIMVKGSHQYLQNETSANQIRALLLAALRGAAFFRHYGGKRIDFMIKRKQYLDIIEQFYSLK